MRKKIKISGKKILKKLGYSVITTDAFQKLQVSSKEAKEFKFIKKYPQFASKYLELKNDSKAQLKQDLFVLLELNFKQNGYFVEFGATDGKSLSNTFLLEKKFGWKGILAEPGKIWHDRLFTNRNVTVETNCVWSSSGKELVFHEVENSSLSTLDGFGEKDSHKDVREKFKSYTVTSISLLDLLEKYKAPAIIDYLSIDTEGSELEILRNFDFTTYKFRIITIEHNYMPIREEIFTLLVSNGYERLHQEFSDFDDWYILKVDTNE